MKSRRPTRWGWDRTTNGRLLDAAEGAGFDVYGLNGPKPLAPAEPQNLTRPRIAVVILRTNHWDTIEADPSAVVARCTGAGQGSYTVVQFPLPPLAATTSGPVLSPTPAALKSISPVYAGRQGCDLWSGGHLACPKTRSVTFARNCQDDARTGSSKPNAPGRATAVGWLRRTARMRTRRRGGRSHRTEVPGLGRRIG
jgi:hypothetical protein